MLLTFRNKFGCLSQSSRNINNFKIQAATNGNFPRALILESVFITTPCSLIIPKVNSV